MGFPEWIPTLVVGSFLMLGMLAFQRWNPLPGLVLTRPRIAFFKSRPQAPASPPVVKYPPIHKTLSAPAATQLFLEWMADNWDENFLSSSQVDDCWRTFSRNRGYYPISCRLIREEMTARGLCLNMKRLSAPEFLHIKHDIGKDRAVVYRRPSKRQLLAPEKTQESSLPEDCLIIAGYATAAPRQATGKLPATARPRRRKRQLTEIPQHHDSFREAA